MSFKVGFLSLEMWMVDGGLGWGGGGGITISQDSYESMVLGRDT